MHQHSKVSLAYEQMLWERGIDCVCGVDEAGRGPLAGPVVAAAVILPHDFVLDGLDDSKKLTEKRREALFDRIREQAVAYAIATVEADEIDRINILQATFRAMQQAVTSLSISADYALIDGNRAPALQIPCQCIVGGDGLSLSIAAASVLAKVTRDRQMRKLDEIYPGYGFATHKGYGTKAHHTAILEQGPTPIHRMTFLKKLYEKHPEVRP